MADHDWPAGLPCWAINGFSGEGDDGVKRSQFPGGTKTRPRFTKPPPAIVRTAVYVSPAQLQTLMDFWETTLRRVLPFNYRDMTKPNDTTTVEYRFLARPRFSSTGSPRRFRVELQLEQLTTFQGTFPVTNEAGQQITTDDEGLTT